MRHLSRACVPICFFIFCFACNQTPAPGSTEFIKDVTGKVDDARLINADKNPGDWLSNGRNYSEDRYSALTQISPDNVQRLGLAWSLNIGTTRGIEATPVVVKGIMYISGPWSTVFSIDARTGKQLWAYDPKVPGSYGQKACCDVVNRGVAIYKGKVYSGTIDGRLICLDAASGTLDWEVKTTDSTKPYTITGAPRIVNGKVIIGNGGADYGVRGYITAYDATTGKQVWRFYTVPGDPSKPFESEIMQKAAKTWNGEWWKYGGGGTAWDAMAYDPELKLLFVGTGNGSPWNRYYRSPDGGDNLFLCSILALNPDNGQLVWYYQTTPGEQWDYTSTQPLILADIEIHGEKKKVIMQAPKNGFFYLLDRTNGKLISAKPYVYVNWAKEIDNKTGRPVENEFSRYKNENAVVFPSPIGGHNWQPMAYNPGTKLVYLPVRDNSNVYGNDPTWKYNQPSGFGTGIGWNTATDYVPSKPIHDDTLGPKQVPQERLIAWDPVDQKEVWRLPLAGVWNGGVVTTASGLVFEGTADGKLIAVNANTGKILWQSNLGSGIIAAPISYEIDGKQYITIAAGWGGVVGLWSKFTEQINPGTIYTFALDSNKAMPAFAKTAPKELINLPFTATKEEIQHGGLLYGQFCSVCHGGVADDDYGVIPDLGYSAEATHKILKDIVLKGALENKGMPNFSSRLSEKDVTEIQSYILWSANKKAEEKKSKLVAAK